METKKSEIVGVGLAALILACIFNRFVGLCLSKPTIDRGVDYALQNYFSFQKTGFVLSLDTMALSMTLLVFVLVFGIYFYYKSKGVFRRGEEHGSSRWATAKEMKAFADEKMPINNTLLSKDVKLRYQRGPNYKTERNRNVVVIGGSGSGKTRGYIKPNLMQIPSPENCGKNTSIDEQEVYARSYLVTDPKGVTRVETGHLFEQHGYEVKEFNTIDYASSMHYNPIKYIRSEEDVLTFANCLIANTTPPNANNAGDPFWENSEKLLYQALLNYILTEVPSEDRNLVTLCELLDLGQVEEGSPALSGLDILFKELETGKRYDPDIAESRLRKGQSAAKVVHVDNNPWRDIGRKPQPNHPAVLAYNSFRSGATDTLKSIYISCKVRLAPLRSKQIREILIDDEMELDMFGDRKMICYAVVSAVDPTFNFLFALLIWQMLNQLTVRGTTKYADRGGALPVGVDMLLDEAANFYIPNLDTTIAVVRSYNIGITVVLQSATQLQTRYQEKGAATIINCCDTMVYLGGKDNETLKSLEDIMGQQTVSTDNTSESKGQGGSWSKQMAQHGRALYQASEIAKMDQGECLVLIRGTSPYKGQKYDVVSHKMYPWIDPGHKGARYSRGFDYAAYKQNKRYYENDTELACELYCDLFTSKPYNLEPPTSHVYTMMYRMVVKNIGESMAYNVRGTIEIKMNCLSRQKDVTSFLQFKDFNKAGGIQFERVITRTNRKPLDRDKESEAYDYIEWRESEGKFILHGLSLEPGEKIIYSFAYECNAENMREAIEDEAERRNLVNAEAANLYCAFGFKVESEVRCANADTKALTDDKILKINPMGRAKLRSDQAV